MKTRYHVLLYAVLASLLAFAPSASAQFLNNRTVTVKYFFNGSEVTTTNAVVDSTVGAVEFPRWNGGLSIDVFDTDASHASIRFASLTNGSWSSSSNFLRIIFSETVPTLRFTNVTFGAFDVLGLTGTRLTNMASVNTIDLDLRGVMFPASNSFVRIDIATVPLEVQRVTIGVSQVQICWNSQSTNDYQVQYRSDLTTNEWVALGGIVAGNGTTNCVTDAVTNPKRFYQVLKLP